MGYILFLVSLVLRELLFSIYVDLIRVFNYLYQTSLSIGRARAAVAKNGRQGEEDAWDFGQIWPMILLALPLLAFVEAVVSEGRDSGGFLCRPGPILRSKNVKLTRYLGIE